jgi:hypothetical protein
MVGPGRSWLPPTGAAQRKGYGRQRPGRESVARAAPRGCLGGENGRADRDLKEQLHLKERKYGMIFRKTAELEVAKQIG